MFKNYFLTIIRQILKNKVFSFINIFGLALGMGVCLVIALQRAVKTNPIESLRYE